MKINIREEDKGEILAALKHREQHRREEADMAEYRHGRIELATMHKSFADSLKRVIKEITEA